MRCPDFLLPSLEAAHFSWRFILESALDKMMQADSGYFSELEKSAFLPTGNRIFAAFSQPLASVKYILVGEGPYPREESATGYCFMDGSVHDIWSEKGFSKQVNRATSLRNFLKMLLVAENALHPDNTSSGAVAKVALERKTIPYIEQLDELKQKLLDHGFLLLNAALVFRTNTSPQKEAKAWQPFLETVLAALADDAAANKKSLPVLVLWGKMAEMLIKIDRLSDFPRVCSEHPYNLSFIGNHQMQALFGRMNLLKKGS